MKQPGCRKRGVQQLRWENSIKRDVRKAEEADRWREKAGDRAMWKRIE